MKILIVKPDRDRLEIEADYWEFSQNKFDDSDIVLIFYKNEVSEDEKKEEKPSRQGIIIQKNNFTENLVNVISEEKLRDCRKEKEVVFVGNDVKWEKCTIKTIITDSYIADNEGIIKALDDLVNKEQSIGFLLKQVSIPIIKYDTSEDTFIIEEKISIENK